MIIPVAPINRTPTGLLNFLGIQNGGKNPTTLGDQLAPVWDLGPLYMEPASEWLLTTTNIAATGFTSFHVVPALEIWYVVGIGYTSAPLGAGQSIEFALAMRDADGSRNLPLSETYTEAVTGNRIAAGMQVNTFLTQNQSIGVYTTQLAAGPLGGDFVARIVRLRA